MTPTMQMKLHQHFSGIKKQPTDKADAKREREREREKRGGGGGGMNENKRKISWNCTAWPKWLQAKRLDSLINPT